MAWGFGYRPNLTQKPKAAMRSAARTAHNAARLKAGTIMFRADQLAMEKAEKECEQKKKIEELELEKDKLEMDLKIAAKGHGKSSTPTPAPINVARQVKLSEVADQTLSSEVLQMEEKEYNHMFTHFSSIEHRPVTE